MKNLTLALALVFHFGGCSRVKQQNEYMIVGSKIESDRDSASGEDRRKIIFTIEYKIQSKRFTIKAHCQSFDVKNRCGELRVGESYPFKRDDRVRFLSLDAPDQPSGTVLGIEEEHVTLDNQKD